MRCSIAAAVLGATLMVASPALATEPPAKEAETHEEGAGYAGPLVLGLGVAALGGGMGVLFAAEEEDVTIGGSLMGALGAAGIMVGSAVWMAGDLTEEELEDKTRQAGVAMTVVGSGAVSFGGVMIASSFAEASDVSEATRLAGIAAAGAGAASIITGVILYAVGGSPPEEKKAAAGAPMLRSSWVPEVEVGPLGGRLTWQF